MSSSAFLQRLRADLERDLAPEVEVTLRVAVLAAGDHTRAQIAETLGITDTEVKMAFVRLKKVGTKWRQA